MAVRTRQELFSAGVVNGPSATRTARFIKADVDLSDQFQKYCNMEFNDSIYSRKSSMSLNDKPAIDVMRNSAKLKSGHYEIALPWKDSSLLFSRS